MSDEKKKDEKSYFGRGRDIDSAVEAAEGSNRDRDARAKQAEGIKGVKASDNPHKEGSTLAKLWERKRQAGTLQAQKGK